MAVKKKISIYPLLESSGIQKRRERLLVEKLINTHTQEEIESELPLLPIDRVQWEYHCRSIIKGEPNRLRYLPMLLDVVEDQHPFKFLLWGRQWGKCLEEDEYVYTIQGIKKANQIKNGDVLIDGGTVEGIYKFTDKLFEIVFWNATRIKVNAEHPFMTANGWVKAKDLQCKDKIEFISCKNDTGTWKIGKPMAKFLGYLYSDGYYSDKQSVKFTNTNTNFLTEVSLLASSLFDVRINPRQKNKDNDKDIDIHFVVKNSGYGRWHGNPVIDFIRKHDLMNRDSLGKIQTLPNEELTEFIRGYFNGDGYLWVSNNNNKIEVGFAIGGSKNRAFEFQYILWRLGIDGVVKKEVMGKNDFYRVLVTRHFFIEKILKILDDIKYPDKFKKARLQLKNYSKSTKFIDYKTCKQWVKIRKINKVQNGTVVGFTVNPTHEIYSYLGMRTHNTTMIASDLAYAATTNYDYDQTYFNFKLDALRTFSNNKFRQDVFGTGPLTKYLKSIGNNIGATNKIETYTRSIIDMLLPGSKWENAQGKSNKRIVIDEGQDHDWEYFQNTRETQADTMGDTIIAGIGGYVDTDYYNLWKSTNQMKYIYKRGENYMGYENMSWRADLEFDGEGLVYGDYMIDIQDGKWLPDSPKNFARHGYHLPQTYNPRIPLTIQDAIEKYHVSSEWSIEYKLNDLNYTQVDFRRNVLAEFVEGELKPIVTQDMLKLFDKTQTLTKANDVDHNIGDVIIGIDWGGGGKTIVWIWQCIDEIAPIFKLLWVEKVETNNTKQQEEICFNLIDAYEADFICIDAGGAPDRVQAIQSRYGTRSCRVSYQVRPEKPIPTKEEIIKQESEMRYVIDRTFSINRIIDLIKYPYIDGKFTSNRIILPGADYEMIKWIVKQFVSLEGEKASLKSTGQTYIRYIHKDSEPDDVLQACNYAFIGWDLWKNRSPGPITFTQFKTPNPFGDY